MVAIDDLIFVVGMSAAATEIAAIVARSFVLVFIGGAMAAAMVALVVAAVLP